MDDKSSTVYVSPTSTTKCFVGVDFGSDILVEFH